METSVTSIFVENPIVRDGKVEQLLLLQSNDSGSNPVGGLQCFIFLSFSFLFSPKKECASDFF